MRRSIILNDEHEEMIRELWTYALNHGCNSISRTGIIKACIKQTRDCTKDHNTKSLLTYFDEVQ